MTLFMEMLNTFEVSGTEKDITDRVANCMAYQAKADTIKMLACKKLYDILQEKFPAYRNGLHIAFIDEVHNKANIILNHLKCN